MELQSTVYESMMGELVEPLSDVENAFLPGSKCDALYGRIYAANRRLCQRLGVEEDSDIEELIDCFFEMNRELCFLMYRYGARFGIDESLSKYDNDPIFQLAEFTEMPKISCNSV